MTIQKSKRKPDIIRTGVSPEGTSPEKDSFAGMAGSQKNVTPYCYSSPLINAIADIGDTLIADGADETDQYVIAIRRYQTVIRDNTKELLNKMYGSTTFRTDGRLGVPLEDDAFPEKDSSNGSAPSEKAVPPSGLSSFNVDEDIRNIETIRAEAMVSLAVGATLMKLNQSSVTISKTDLDEILKYNVDYQIGEDDGITISISVKQ